MVVPITRSGERLNEEVKRGSAVLGIFPNKETAIRTFGAVLGEQNDEWLVTTRHVSAESMQALFHPKDTLSSSASKCRRRRTIGEAAMAE